MKKLFTLMGILFLSGCMSKTSANSESENDESDNLSDNLENSDAIIDFNGPKKKEVDTCGNSYTYHTIIFDNKTYIIRLPIACSQEKYIEKGTPPELDDEINEDIVNKEITSY